jgi:two-component system, OmpR family, sensor histidine kinase VanS
MHFWQRHVNDRRRCVVGMSSSTYQARRRAVLAALIAAGAISLTACGAGQETAKPDTSRPNEPFVRGAGRVAQDGSPGSGLGLAIVARVAATHDACLRLDALETGGLDVRVTFPAPADGSYGPALS